MTAPATPTVHERTKPQLRASDPGAHVWVSASAGTGKTAVLTDRMLRLMLAGSPPERLLALTFTKAAAAEMQNRLTRTLSDWLTLSDDALADQLDAVNVPQTPAMLHRARMLFALALDVPGGLKVQTLHGFAQGLLAAFPLEAGLPPGFVALDERDTLRLKGRALTEMIVQAQATGDSRLLDDLAELAIASGEGGVKNALGVLQAHAEALQQFGSADAVEPAVRRWLGLADGATEQATLEFFFAPGTHDDERLQAYAAMMAAWHPNSGGKNADAARLWLAGDAAARSAGFQTLRNLFLTKTENTPKVERHAVAKFPQLRGLIDEMAQDLLAIEATLAKFAIAETAVRALRIGVAYTARYAALKRAQVAIDYDDMIARAAALLGEPGTPGWVAWKLDSRFDHILVDEAQDTNRAQWDIIRKLSEDYFDGEDARHRSLFVVGDMKQAIFGFQGTDPQVFAAEQGQVGARAAASGRPLDSVPLDRSFRSGPAVLELVNAFMQDVGGAALGMNSDVPPHVANRATAGSEVVLWPVQVAQPTADEEDAADEEVAEEASKAAANRALARTLAAQIAAWLRPGDPQRLWLPARTGLQGGLGRWVQPQDILLLLRTRGALMAALVAALHEARVPVAGVDRLLLTEPYAVLDLLALARFAVQPEDDLNLTCLLVSPFIGWDHETVRQLSGPRKTSLWAALGTASDARSQAARGWLAEVLGMADRETPYRFLDTILSGPLDGRRKLLARLGSESSQAIDELLAQALAFEATHPPSLQAFLAWIEADGVVVKRDADAPSHDVRLMTIHGAKGLEAPVVILADAANDPNTRDDGYLPVTLAGHTAAVPLFHGGVKRLSGDALRLHEAAKVAREQEELRLLYVALTRAADHLFIAGAVSAKQAKKLGGDTDRCWHSRMQRVMQAMPDVQTADCPYWKAAAAEGQASLLLQRGSWTERGPDVAIVAGDPSALAIASGVDLTAAPEPSRPPRPLTPSALGRDDLADAPPTAAMRDAAFRGRLLHSLFERLPPVAPDRREAVALAWLRAQGASDPQALLTSAMAVIEAPEFAALFGPEALAEAPIAGVDGPLVIAGTVDRLVVTAERVQLVDFKTGVRVPSALSDVPIAYVRQLAAYRAVLAKAFPGRAIEAALLYTAEPKLILLPEKLLDAHWPPATA